MGMIDLQRRGCYACRDRAINPFDLIAPESHHLIEDAEALCLQIAAANPRLVLGFPTAKRV